MPSRILFAVALVLASGAALSKMSECEADCEDVYKACVTSGKMSERACMVELEKCRRACLKETPSGG